VKPEDFDVPDTARDSAIRLIAILFLSNEAEQARDPFVRRIKLNELQSAIQSAKGDIEALAEGLALN
jgi:hypothetical protein